MIRRSAGYLADGLFLNGHKINRRVLASSVDLEIEFEPLAFVDALQAGAFNGTDVHERVWLSIIADQKAEAFHRVEEFHRTGCFFTSQFTLWSAACRAFAAFTAAGTATAAIGYRNDIAHDLEILCRNLAAAINQVEFERLAFCQAGKTRTLDCTDMDERVFTAVILLDEAEALLRIEELYRSLARADHLGRHTAETAATSARARTAPGRTAGATATPAATEPVAATKTVASASAAAKAITAAIAVAAEATLRFTTERRETVFTETIALIASPAPAPFIVTHNKLRTFVTPP